MIFKSKEGIPMITSELVARVARSGLIILDIECHRSEPVKPSKKLCRNGNRDRSLFT